MIGLLARFAKPNPKAIAQERLAKLVEETRNLYETRRFRERREAAIKGRSA